MKIWITRKSFREGDDWHRDRYSAITRAKALIQAERDRVFKQLHKLNELERNL